MIAQCAYYFHAHYARWKMLSSQGRGFSVALPSRPWRLTSEDGSLRLTQVTLNLGWGKAVAATGALHGKLVPSHARAFHSFILHFPSCFTLCSHREGGHKVEAAFAYHAHETFEMFIRFCYLVLSLHLDLIVLASVWLIRFWWSATQHSLPVCPYSPKWHY